MAYEVARVHGLILSNIQDGEKDGGEPWPPVKNASQMPRSSPDSPFLTDFPSERNQWSESSHSSSLESSTETETESEEEDDFIAGLAEQIAHSMLDDDEPGNVSSGVDALDDRRHTALPSGRLSEEQKVPAATQLSWSPNISSSSWSDSLASSKQSSQMSSPPSTPSTSESDAWDLLNAAAGEVVRLKMKEDSRPAVSVKETKVASGNVANLSNQCSPVRPPGLKSTAPYLVPLSGPSGCSGNARSSPSIVSSKERLMPGGAAPSHAPKNWTRLREEPSKDSSSGSVQHRLSRNDGVGWNQRQSRSANHLKGNVNQKFYRQNYNSGGHSRMSGRAVESGGGPRPGVHGVNGGSGMRAVFLGTGSGRETGGTGVFLPRCAGGGPDQRRKPACSTVLLPSRIVQVLNLNVEDMRTHPSLPSVSPHNRNDSTGPGFRPPPQMYMMDLTSGAMRYGGENISTFPRKVPAAHVRQNEPAEYFLPTEWTY